MKLKSVVFLMSVLLSGTFATAQDADQNINSKIQFIDVQKGMDWLSENATRIYSLTTEIDTLDEQTGITANIKSEFISPKTSEECEKYDVENKYSNYFYYSHTEEVKKDGPGYSSWFEGKKLEGKVVKKVISFCFAN
jgi:hypothetical protein